MDQYVFPSSFKCSKELLEIIETPPDNIGDWSAFPWKAHENGHTIKAAKNKGVQRVTKKFYKNNKSGVTGVSWKKQQNKWEARVFVNGKKEYIGSFICKIDAARAVNNKWIELGWDKLGRNLNDLEHVSCCCEKCLK